MMFEPTICFSKYNVLFIPLRLILKQLINTSVRSRDYFSTTVVNNIQARYRYNTSVDIISCRFKYFICTNFNCPCKQRSNHRPEGSEMLRGEYKVADLDKPCQFVQALLILLRWKIEEKENRYLTALVIVDSIPFCRQYTSKCTTIQLLVN